MPKVAKVDPLNPDREILRDAAKVLRRGGVVAFPTETVYGLGADAMNPNAVKKVFEIKGRPPDNPLIVHISSFNMLFDVTNDLSEDIIKILRILWPGPFTAILKKKESVPDITTAGLPFIAVRMPAHPVALALIEEFGKPIAAPSANKSGKPSPTIAEHVIEDLGDSVDLIIDGGETFFGVESTILDLTKDPPTLLRPGPIDPEALERIIGKKILIPSFARGLGEAEKALAPGMRYRHYAPDKKLILIENGENIDICIRNIIEDFLSKMLKPCIVGYEEYRYIASIYKLEFISLGSTRNPYEIARNLYKGLRSVDKTSADLCIAIGIDEKGIGLAIMNRLRKASGYNIVRCKN
ncbi:MAG: L-threonylcarbamoyladenylate synthase [Sulfolobales archaeon]